MAAELAACQHRYEELRSQLQRLAALPPPPQQQQRGRGEEELAAAGGGEHEEAAAPALEGVTTDILRLPQATLHATVTGAGPQRDLVSAAATTAGGGGGRA